MVKSKKVRWNPLTRSASGQVYETSKHGLPKKNKYALVSTFGKSRDPNVVVSSYHMTDSELEEIKKDRQRFNRKLLTRERREALERKKNKNKINVLEPIAEEDQSQSQRDTEDTMESLKQMRRQINQSKQSRIQSASHIQDSKKPSSWVDFFQETCSNGVCYLKNRLGIGYGIRKNKTHKNSKSHNKTKHHKKDNINQSRKRRHIQKKH